MKPAFLGYGGFPGSACVSVNDELVHGIPNDSRELSFGDIVTETAPNIPGYVLADTKTFTSYGRLII